MRIDRISNTVFSIYIEDTREKMYTPDNSVNSFQGPQWNDAIQRGDLITKLEIILLKIHKNSEMFLIFPPQTLIKG